MKQLNRQYIKSEMKATLPGLQILFVILFTATNAMPQTVVYRSANPKEDLSVAVNDMIKIDYGYFTRLKKDMTGGIWSTGSPVSAITKLSVYAYSPGAVGGKGPRIYYVYLTGNEMMTTARNGYRGNTEDVIKTILIGYPDNVTGIGPVISVPSNDIKSLAQDARDATVSPDGQPYCDFTRKTWLESLGDFFSGTIPNPNQNCVLKPKYQPVQPVIVEIETDNPAAILKCKVPGIMEGDEIIIENGKVIVQHKNALAGYCEQFVSDPLCTAYDKLRHPVYDPNHEDIYLSHHRGHWGYNLGKGLPENSKESIAEAFSVFPQSRNVEIDIAMTSDNNLVMMHDYVMKRLTDYRGPEFSFDLPLDKIEQYYTRRRNETVSPYKISRYTEVLDKSVSENAILMLDAKEMQIKKKYFIQGQFLPDGLPAPANGDYCVVNCQYESKESQKQSWGKIINQAIDQPSYKVKNLIIKTYFDVNEVERLIGERINSVMWTPILIAKDFSHPGDSQEKIIDTICKFIEAWEKKAKDNVAYYETNFFRTDDVMLQSFSRNGHAYVNMLHYIYATTGRRTGIFSEEPAGPRGCVNRWGDWTMKDCRVDIRPDPYVLLTIPYANIMVVTTDRPDVWKQIKERGF